MKGIIATIAPLAGVGAFWLVFKSPQYAPLIWGLLIGGTLLALFVALVGVFAPPQLAPILLWAWVVFLPLFGLLLAVACYFAILWIGEHVGKARPADTSAVAIALGAAIGVIATAIYNLIATKISYKSFARRAVYARYQWSFPTKTTDGSTGFNAGRAAVRHGGGTIEVPDNWNFPGAVKTRTEGPSPRPITTVVIDGWGFKAVGVRRGLIQKALAEARATAPTAPQARGSQPRSVKF
jgi:hypothetical protein